MKNTTIKTLLLLSLLVAPHHAVMAEISQVDDSHVDHEIDSDFNIDNDGDDAQTRSCYDSKKNCCKKKKIKKFCNICAQCISASALNVSGNAIIGGELIVGGVNFNTLAGIAGSPGLAGAIGAAGADGAPGTIGIPGIPGIGGVLAWGYIYNVGAQTVNDLAGSPVFFDSSNALLLNGISHTPGTVAPSDAITVTNAGTYLINFSLAGLSPNQFAIAVNGSLVADASTVYGSGAGNQQNNGQAILVLQAGDVVRLVNYRSAPGTGTLQTLAGGTATNVNASIIILRIA